MNFIGRSDSSIACQRPAPVFVTEERLLSTKKSRSLPRITQPPKAPVKSCPVTRIFSRIPDTDRPQPVSFREDSDTSFIVHSPVYSPEKAALYFEQCYVIEQRLGAGSFGEVFRVRSHEDGRPYACKRTLLRFRGEGDRRRRMQEVQKHEKLPKHRNCVEFYRAWEERQHLYLLTEVCRASLADLAEDRHDLPESVVWEYLVDLLQGVSHLHRHNLVHMDIKPENIFFGYDGLCKLGDFGLVIDTSQGPVVEAVEGDPKYLAPELMKLQFSSSADLFSLGMTILELATDLDLPKQGEMWQGLRQGALPPAAGHLSKDLQAVLMGLLHPDPSERLTADEALALRSVRRVLLRKNVKDCWRRCVMRAERMLSLAWLYMTVFLAVLMRPLRCVWERKVSEEPQSHSSMNVSDSDFALGFSDDEGLDDHSLAQPLGDISTSSNEGGSCVNSTPISFQSRRLNDFFSASPTGRNSPVGSPRPDESPLFVHRRPMSRRSARESYRPDESPSFEDVASPFNLTSRNLINLFNAAESDED